MTTDTSHRILLLEDIRHSPHVCMAEATRAANRALSRHYGAYLDGAGIAPGQASLLMQLYYLKDISVADFAARMRTERTTMIRNIAALERAGRVETFTPEGSRTRHVRLTDAGRCLLADIVTRWDAAQQALKAQLGAEQWATLISALNALADLPAPLPDPDATR
ncbi:MAG: MarR family transcriptional regulator [Hyphomonadaceae bacterium]|nr:MarR family transcriptional regulator [Hyphomonadaceae bacterium]